MNANIKLVYEDMVNNSEQVPKWNPAVKELHVLKKVDNSTEITRNIAAKGGSFFTPISSRYARRPAFQSTLRIHKYAV